MNELPRLEFERLGPPAGHSLLVIGGCGGIGHALVEHARKLGLTTAIMDLQGAGERRGLTAKDGFVAVDLRDEESVVAAIGQLRDAGLQFDGVAVCSGYTKGYDRISEFDTSRFDDVLSGNLRGPLLALREVLPLLTADASVVVLTTGIGQIGAPGYAGYGASKAGLNAIIRILAAEVAPGIRVNGVAPGAVDTAFIRGGFAEGASEAGKPQRFDADKYNSLVPMGRMAVTDDIVGPILFLLSENARYVTGQVLHVNGGALMRD